ncbi:MAG: hypothetical protein HRU01_05110 [Myxococcales bacterium]|nr:hypothetical protein [Myxococcales bacterium]
MAPVASPGAARIAGLGLLGVAAAILFVAARPLATDDLWWHLRMGEVYATGDLWPDEDPLVHTTHGRPPVPHEWLFQVAVHGVDVAAGHHGLRVLHALAVVVVLSLAFATLRRGSNDLGVAALATSVFAALSWYRLVQFRPDLLSIPLTLVLYRAVLREPSAPGRATFIGGLLLLLAWANAHSVFGVGLALVFAACVGVGTAWWADRGTPAAAAVHRARFAALVLFLVLAMGVTALNPRGFHQLATFFQYSRESAMWAIEDDWTPWNPFAPLEGNRALTLFSWGLANALLVAFAAAALRSLWCAARDRARCVALLDPVHLALGGAGLVAMFASVRFHWLSVFPLLYVVRALRREAEARGGLRHAGSWTLAALAVAIAVAFPAANRLGDFASEVAQSGRGYLAPGYLETRYCDAGSRFLADTKLEGRLFNPYFLGGFLAYWHAPRLRTYIDGRMDHYPRAVYHDYRDTVTAATSGAHGKLRALLDERAIDIFFAVNFPSERYANLQQTAAIRRLPEWVRVFQSHYHAVYLRRHARNELNFFRIAAHYRERGVPFDGREGLDIAAIVAAAPPFAFESGLLSPSHADLLADLEAGASPARDHALEALAERYWRIGNHADQVVLDAELVERAPDSREPRRRLADGLLQLGRAEEALAVARTLYAVDPDYKDIENVYRLADGVVTQRKLAGSEASARGTVSERAAGRR